MLKLMLIKYVFQNVAVDSFITKLGNYLKRKLFNTFSIIFKNNFQHCCIELISKYLLPLNLKKNNFKIDGNIFLIFILDIKYNNN